MSGCQHSGSCNRLSLCTLFADHFTAFILDLLQTTGDDCEASNRRQPVCTTAQLQQALSAALE